MKKQNYWYDSSLSSLARKRMPRSRAAVKLANMRFAIEAPVAGASYETMEYIKETFPTVVGEEGRILRMRPKTLEAGAPALVYFHGGGFRLKAAPHHYRLAKQYAIEARCQVLMVDYRLLPVYSFPYQTEDAFCAWKWVTEHAEAMQLDPKRIAIGGDGVGGGLAAGCALRARDEDAPRPCFQMLLYPILDRYNFGNSAKTYSDAPVWDVHTNKRMWNEYLDSALYQGAKYATPAREENYRDLPPAYVEPVGNSCVLSEGINYAGHLESCVPTEINFIREGIHGFDAVEDSPITREAVSRRIAALKKAFAK